MIKKSNLESKTFNIKPKELQNLILQALTMLQSFGIPLENLTPRKLERIGMAFLAVCDVNQKNGWKHAKDLNDKRSMKTRDIINYWNKYFNENVSLGSYDDVRRKDLVLLSLGEVIISSKPDTATNNPSRGYALNPLYSNYVRCFGDSEWFNQVQSFMSQKIALVDKFKQKRKTQKIKVNIPDGTILKLNTGEHNLLQKLIIEEFLPRFGYNATVLYLGDASKKLLIYEKDILQELGFFDLDHQELPDVIAYSKEKNWLYVIEAVYSCNPVTITRKIKIDALTSSCTAGVIYVSAFINRKSFNSFVSEIAWETEVWLANEPDHLIHFNGDKFLGPQKLNKK